MKQKWLKNARMLVVIMLLLLVITVPLEAQGVTKDNVTYSISNDVITLKWGEKPSGGYAIAINSMKREGPYLTVYYALRSPTPDEVVTMAITHPQISAPIPSGTQKILQVRLVRQTWKDTAVPVPVNNLPTVGDAATMKKLMEEANMNRGVVLYSGADQMMTKSMAAPAPAAVAAPVRSAAQAENAAGDYSRTNTQVAGVDEADLIKTDGQYIYQIVENKVRIIKAYPATAMTAAATLSFDSNFRPTEIYVDNKYLVVIGGSVRNYPMIESGSAQKMYAPPYSRFTDTSRVMVYDITDRAQPKSVREVEISGYLVASRKIGSVVYLVTNQGIYGLPGDPGFPVPLYKDSAAGNQDVNVDFKDIRYFPGCITPNYLVVAGIDIASQSKASVESYLGAGNQVYVSPGNLYVAASYYPARTGPIVMPAVEGEMVSRSAPAPTPANDTTRIFKFILNKGQVAYSAEGAVPGQVLNQFSMDENNGYFRVATTTNRYDGSGSSNGLYVLDAGLKTVGKVEDIAPGEKIYSARFMGERAYMVTFRTVDPFYVIDLKVPSNPKILGALKIPGYSDYLHPYDANHVIGFGKDTVELSNQYAPGQTTAYYMGMKMALFDVSDVSNPKQKFVQIIGDRGTDSELLHNHRALLFSKEKNLIAFPVSLHQVDASAVDQKGGFPEYGAFTWQGAYVYGLDLQKGFQLKAKISHMTDDDYLKAGYIGYNSRKTVQRILYIQDTLYTLSPAMIKANSLEGFKDVGVFNY